MRVGQISGDMLVKLALMAGAIGVGWVMVSGLKRSMPGGAGGLASDVARALTGTAVDVASGATSGVVDGVSDAVGLPSTRQTVTDAQVARWVIDNMGYFEASKWVSVPALWAAKDIKPGTGTPPRLGTALADAIGLNTAF